MTARFSEYSALVHSGNLQALGTLVAERIGLPGDLLAEIYFAGAFNPSLTMIEGLEVID
jgi:hypothetical protein